MLWIDVASKVRDLDRYLGTYSASEHANHNQKVTHVSYLTHRNHLQAMLLSSLVIPILISKERRSRLVTYKDVEILLRKSLLIIFILKYNHFWIEKTVQDMHVKLLRDVTQFC